MCAARGTLLEGATLEIIEIPGRARCERCGAELDDHQLTSMSARVEASNLRVLAGEELRVKNLELVPDVRDLWLW